MPQRGEGGAGGGMGSGRMRAAQEVLGVQDCAERANNYPLSCANPTFPALLLLLLLGSWAIAVPAPPASRDPAQGPTCGSAGQGHPPSAPTEAPASLGV